MFHQLPVVGPIVSLGKESAIINTSATNLGKSVMDSRGGVNGVYTSLTPSTRTQEKEELQRLNDRFSAYIARVRLLNQHSNNVDSSAFLSSTKILEDEITNLKKLYENELDALRKEIEAGAIERSALHSQNNKQQKYIGDLKDRLTIETDKNSRLLDEINTLQRRIGNLEAAVKDAHIAAQRPQEEVEQLQRTLDSLSRELDQWKQRCEQEIDSKQKCEERLQQVLRKVEFSDQVHNQQIKDYQNRLDAAAATILSMEARIRELSSPDVSVNEVLKQVREAAEAELRKYQAESEDQYVKNLSALKAKIDSDADTIQRLSQEKTELIGNIGELQAKIWNLEGQVANLQQQNQTLQGTVTFERKQAADNIHQLEKKLRDVQDTLVTKMFEMTSARDSNIPLKAEIEALKRLLEGEEARLQVVTSAAYTRMSPLPASDILRTNSLKAAPSGYLQPNAGSYVQRSADSQTAYNLGGIHPPYYNDPVGGYSTSYIADGFYPDGDRLTYNPGYDRELTDDDLYKHEFSLHETGPHYIYENSPSLSRLQIESSLPSESRFVGPIPVRASSAPVKLEKSLTGTKRPTDTKTKEKKWNYTPASFGCGRDYFQGVSPDVQQQTRLSTPRPQSSSVERKMPSNFHDYTVSTSSATGDLKILEVDEDGRFVRLINDGPREVEIGGYILRQNINGHPVAVFKFPPNVKMLPSSTTTVWSAMNDPELHNPPADFVWPQQEKWGTGPECSTILCRANGQAVAWTTAAHRHPADAPEDASPGKIPNVDLNIRDDDDDIIDQDMKSSKAKPELVNLRREKQQPPLLSKARQHQGSSSAAFTNPQAKQQSTLLRSYKYKGTLAQPNNSMAVKEDRKPPTIRGNGTLVNKLDGSISISPHAPYSLTLDSQLIDRPRDQSGFMVPLASQA